MRPAPMPEAPQQPTDTLFLGGLDGRVTRKLLLELCCQAGPVVKISLPLQEGNEERHRGYGFCQYASVESAKYAHELFQGTVKLFGRPLRIKYSPQGKTETPEE